MTKRNDKDKNIAFCFLLYDSIEHLPVWEIFLSQGHNFSIYSHVKTITQNTPEWIKKASVKTVNTDWCGEGLIYAFNEMLKEGLKDKKNKFFALLSGSCIPLYEYQKTYSLITKDPRAKMNYEKYKGDVFEDRTIYKSHQWVVLNRKVARDYIRLGDKNDKKAQKFISQLHELYLENGVKVGDFKAEVDPDKGWLGGCPDDVYPINWLVELYGKK